LLRVWNYPAHLANAVAYHHQPLSSGIHQLETSLVHVSDYLVNAMELGSSGERFVPPLHPKAWDRLAMATDGLSSIIDNIDNQIGAVEDAFLH
jgi:hypothetical protein